MRSFDPRFRPAPYVGRYGWVEFALEDVSVKELEELVAESQVKGSSDTLKRGTSFKNIRLIEDDEESIECGSGRNTVVLKTCFLKKS